MPSDTPTYDAMRQLLALEKYATPGKWYAIHCDVYSGTGTGKAAVAACGGSPGPTDSGNADLVAHARNAIRPVCEELLEARAEIAKMKTACDLAYHHLDAYGCREHERQIASQDAVFAALRPFANFAGRL